MQLVHALPILFWRADSALPYLFIYLLNLVIGVIVRVGDLPDAVVYHQFEVVETLLHIAMHVVDLLMPMGMLYCLCSYS